MKNKVQKFGKFLSEMVMPNIGALIAFGFLAAMIMGPLAGFCIKKFDQLMDGHMPVGFEMLINNFSAGIIGMLLAILGYVVVGPVMRGILTVQSLLSRQRYCS